MQELAKQLSAPANVGAARKPQARTCHLPRASPSGSRAFETRAIASPSHSAEAAASTGFSLDADARITAT